MATKLNLNDIEIRKNEQGEQLYPCNYSVAVHWCRNNLVPCHNIAQIDDSIVDNMRFPFMIWKDEDENEYSDYDDIPEDKQDTAYEEQHEIYQWYLTDCSLWDVEYLEKTFGLLFTYSDLLDCYVLCVDHFGTGWDYVYCDTTNEHAACMEGETIDDLRK